MRLSGSVVLLVAVISTFSASFCRADIVAPQEHGHQHVFSAPINGHGRHGDGSAYSLELDASVTEPVNVSDQLHWEARLMADLDEAARSLEIRSASSAVLAADEAVYRIEFSQEASTKDKQSMVDWLEDNGADIWQRSANQITWRLVSGSTTSVGEAVQQAAARGFMMRGSSKSVASELAQDAARGLQSYDQLRSRLESPGIGLSALLANPDAGIHGVYHSYASIESMLHLFASDYSDFAKLQKIGHSSEGRTLWSLRISDYRQTPSSSLSWRALSYTARRVISGQRSAELAGRKRNLAANKHKKRKLGFAIIAGQHAREWIGPATTLYVAHSLLNAASRGASSFAGWRHWHEVIQGLLSGRPQDEDEHSEIMTLLSDYELHIVPVVNPDGYVYTWEHDRLWQKSRQPLQGNYTSARDCIGIDLNRNWGYKFAPAQRPNPCSDVYSGKTAFDAPELQALSRYLKQVNSAERSGLDVFLDLHSFGQMLMYPYSFSCDKVAPDAENLDEALLRAGKAIRDVFKLRYEVGSSCDVSYVASGQSLDWAYHDLKAKWSFAANLRDQGVYAFMLPPSQIAESGREILAGVLELAKFVAQKEKIEPSEW